MEENMKHQACYQRFMLLNHKLALLHERLRSFASEADRIANIPPKLFDEVDVRALNCNGLETETDIRKASTISQRCEVFELLGHGDPALAVALPGASLTLSVIQRLASQSQRARICETLQSDEPRWGAFAMTEPQSGSDATHMALTARQIAGGYSLAGTKCYIGNAGRAQYAIVFATIDPNRGQFGIRAFFLPLPAKGLIIDDNTRMLGLRAVRVSRLMFDECCVPNENILGHGTGIDLARTFSYAQTSFDSMRPCLSSLIVGASFGVIDHLTNGSRASGRLGQAVDALVERFVGPLNSARMLCRHAAKLLDAGTNASAASSICKLYATEQACALTEQALLIPGIAAHQAFPTLLRLHRDFQAFRMMEGTSDVHRLMIARDRIARHRKLQSMIMATSLRRVA
jgi:acyl-CoA dehydrogenase